MNSVTWRTGSADSGEAGAGGAAIPPPATGTGAGTEVQATAPRQERRQAPRRKTEAAYFISVEASYSLSVGDDTKMQRWRNTKSGSFAFAAHKKACADPSSARSYSDPLTPPIHKRLRPHKAASHNRLPRLHYPFCCPRRIQFGFEFCTLPASTPVAPEHGVIREQKPERAARPQAHTPTSRAYCTSAPRTDDAVEQRVQSCRSSGRASGA